MNVDGEGGYGSRLALRGGDIVLEINHFLADWVHLVSLCFALRIVVFHLFDWSGDAVLLVLRVESVELRVEFGKLILFAFASGEGEGDESDDNNYGFTHVGLLRTTELYDGFHRLVTACPA